MENIVTEVLLAIFVSAGFWTGLWKVIEVIVVHKLTKPKLTPEVRLLRGIGQLELVFFGLQFKKRGYLTPDEYHTLKVEVFEPYTELGGNGLAKKMMDEIEELPIHHDYDDQRVKKDEDET